MNKHKHTLIMTAAIFAVGLVAFSCCPKVIERTITKTEYRDRYVRDSMFVHDSIWLKEYVKGDTVYVNKNVYKYIYKDKYKTDTLRIEVHDSTTVQVPVEKKLNAMQKMKINSFWYLVIAVFALLVWTFRKYIIAFFKMLI